ncbi:MAG TPA: M1 family metallopeptidase [Pirellulaceae bacterium]|nr:M1 family metallopeptidase [Pirellulaceae bacterium]
MFVSFVRSCRFALAAMTACGLAASSIAFAVDYETATDKFAQLEPELPTPNEYRTASGAPGHAYWQQQANYEIDVTLDEAKRRLTGRETVTYFNRSPNPLGYLWMQLEQNIFDPNSDANLTETRSGEGRLSFDAFRSLLAKREFPGGYKIDRVRDADGKDLPFFVNRTMMRIELPRPLAPGESIVFSVAWEYAINDATVLWARTGYEPFEKDGNDIYEMAHWFPRMAAYTDYAGWQHKQFLGRGEFTLEFGDYVVRITAPKDHVVAATGTLLNDVDVLSEEQRKRLAEARTAKKPVFVVTPDEAKEAEKAKATETKTWVFKADNVRDFAWASSRKFIWDAVVHKSPTGHETLCMSYYPKEAEPLWSKYSTASIVHTIDVYSKFTFDYPYPVAISVNGPVYGMEYPMICFNGPRPEEDGTYSDRTKYGLISVVIHEVGHNWFPMIVNSDERQWTWMDEGLNTFLQYLAEQEWEEKYPAGREPRRIVEYMTSSSQEPIMTNSESITQFGANAYAKPATALNILRESVLGRENFDRAFKEYANRWKFKRPTPADFFRTMEDASGTDLDWFFRGWFYTTERSDLGIVGVELYQLDTGDPKTKKAEAEQKEEEVRPSLSQQRNQELPKLLDARPDLKDFYNAFDPHKVLPSEIRRYEEYLKGLTEEERKLLSNKFLFYVVKLKNDGGLPMPVTLELTYEDGKTEELRIPAEIWRLDAKRVDKMIVTTKKLARVEVDPYGEIADTDASDNAFPPEIPKSRFELFKEGKQKNQMQKAADEEKAEEEFKKKTKEEKAKKAAEKKAGEKSPSNEKAPETKDEKVPPMPANEAEAKEETSDPPGDEK